jgi:short-subunit dehydrogenase
MKNEIIWITGASSGIGRELVSVFIKAGKTVAVSARKVDMLEKLKEGLGDKRDLIQIVQCDVSDYESVSEAYHKITKEFQVIALINAAGITSFKPAVEDTIEEIQKIVNTNLLGSIYTIKTVIPAMIKANKGSIINIISIAAKKVFTNSSVYAASKSGLLAYTNVLREEVRKNNIRIANILPGATKTPIWPNKSLEKFSDRMMTPGDVASLIFSVYSADGTAVPEEISIRPIKGDL